MGYSLYGFDFPKDLADFVADSTAGTARASACSVEHAAVAAAMAAAATDRSLVLIAPSTTAADRALGVLRHLLEYGPVPRDFPRWPTGRESPWEPVIESPFLAAARLGVLAAYSLAENAFVSVMDASRAATRVMPFTEFCEGLYRVQTGRPLDIRELVELLVRSGYRRTSSVAEVGEFAVRNAVLDVYSPFHEDPFRIEIDFDEVESLKFFDPATQRSRRSADHVWVVPAWEIPCGESSFRDAGIRLRDAAALFGIPSADVAAIENQIAGGRAPAGFAGMMPFLFEKTDLPLDYVGDDVLVAVVDPEGCRASADAAFDDLAAAYADVCAGTDGRLRTLAAEPGALASRGSELMDQLGRRPGTMLIDIRPGNGLMGASHPESTSPDLVLGTTPDVAVADRVAGLTRFANRLLDAGDGIILLAPSESESRRVSEIMQAEGLVPGTAMVNGLAGLLTSGSSLKIGTGRIKVPFGIQVPGVFVIPTESVFGVKDVVATRHREKKNLKKIQEFRELSKGDMVIHRDHGMGIFEGMTDVTVDGLVSECLVLSYKGGDRLYVPVDRANLLDRYLPPAEGEARQLDRLGSQAWVRRKSSARSAAKDIAAKLRTLYARRLAATAPAMSAPDNEFREFESTFHWDTTPDQEKAIEEILEDLQKTTPTDRLVCGDVGFGKTEVAVRAAFKAVSDGYQVAVLVPTTILAEQHRLTFAARFRNTPVVVDSVSRFKSQKEIKSALDSLRTGGTDIIVGTHRLLSEDVKFSRLGLLIIDEEHRFGVAHKERLREMSVGVHTISLTATPIPRTLHMALSGIRELSLITTPPRDRLAVRTFVARTGTEIIRSAILREVNRGGQVFVVHNRVEDIFDFASTLSAAVPEARFCVAHGQMSAADLESVMSAFVRGEKDVLVATTIIESGLDIGTANTMLIHDADRLGLAQMYQLRGRVGRSSEQAYCYLLVRDPARLSDDARARIEAIERFSELASGFNLASMDLAIRGSGDILGAEQSGHMAAVGEEMFMEMLRDAVMELAGEEVRDVPDPDVKVDVESRIPAEFVPDERLRLRFYKRLSSAEDAADVDYIVSELADRFGSLPPQVSSLASVMRIRIWAARAGLASVSLKSDVLTVSAFEESTGLEATLNHLVGKGFERMGSSNRARWNLRLPPAFRGFGIERLALVESALAGVV